MPSSRGLKLVPSKWVGKHITDWEIDEGSPLETRRLLDQEALMASRKKDDSLRTRELTKATDPDTQRLLPP